MSAIGGLFTRSGVAHASVATEQALGHLERGLRQIGPDALQWWADEPVTLLTRAFLTTPGAGPELVCDGHLVLAWNGRLDNRAEICQRLGRAWSDASSGDASLVAALFALVGEEALGLLVGDFSLALWHRQARRLVLATDVFALRPLFYNANSERVWFSSRARALLAAADLPATPDEVGAAAFLTFIDAGHHTVLHHVQMVPPAHALVVEQRGGGLHHQLVRYWSPVPRQTLGEIDDGEAEQRFRELFFQAVSDRLRARGPVWADLSGGLDSSSIVCVADHLQKLRDGGAAATPVRTISWVYDRAQSSDERHFLTLVEQQRQRRGLHLSDENYPLLKPLPSALNPDLPSGQIPFHRRYAASAEAMAADGARVLLRGSGGDHIFWGEMKAPFGLADRLARGAFGDLLSSARMWARKSKEPLLKTLWQGGIWPLLPRALRRRSAFIHGLDGWFNADFLRRIDWRDRQLGPEAGPDEHEFELPSQRVHWSLIAGVGRFVGWEMPLQEGCIEARFPFLDRRLVEFSLALPIEQKLRPGETRSVLRRGLRGILPEEIRRRQSKSGPDEALYRALRRESQWLGELLTDSRLAAHGWIESDALEGAVAAARHGVLLNSPQLLRALTLEEWLRSLDSAPASGAIETAFESSLPGIGSDEAGARYTTVPG